MGNHYFCAHPETFNRDCQVIKLKEGDVLWKVAIQWMKANGYRHVYVYDMEHRYVWDFSLPPS